MDNGHERRRAVQLMILLSYTVIALVLFGESLLLGWDMSAAALFVLGGVACWILHITRMIPREQRMWLCVILTMLAFFFYGLHETSLYDLAPVMIGAMIMFSAMEQYSVIRLCVIVYYLTVGYALVFIIGENMEYTALSVTRLLLHFLLVSMAARLIRSNIRRRADAKRELEEEVSRLAEFNRRTENFLTNVSHELRTPINAVTGVTQMMLKNETDPKKREDIISVEQAGQRLFGQIEDILDYTEIDTGKICVVNDTYIMSSLVNDLMIGCQYGQNEHAPELIVNVDAKLPAVLEGDARKIKKILKHLIGNALKFTKTGGVYVYIYGLKKEYGINLCIRVSDTGEGIEKEQLSRITERFFQSSEGQNRKKGGLGLGLSIVQGLVSAMDGFMQINSTVGKGTTVEISIPQKVVDESPAMAVEHKDSLCLACYIRQEKYKIAEVRNYYNEMISSLATGLELPIHRVFDLKEMKKLISIYHLTHLLVASEEYEEEPAFFEMLAEKTMVIVVASSDETFPAGRKVILVKKPLYNLQIIHILNADQADHPKMWNDMRMICSGVRALVVDDEPMNLMVARGILSDYKVEVQTAASGLEAIEICKQEDFDLLFLDHMMPGMDGVEALHRIRKILEIDKREITAIAFTANAVSGAREMFQREGFDEFISKPIEKAELECILRRVLPAAKLAYVSPLKLNGLQACTVGKKTFLQKPMQPATWLDELKQAGINTTAGLEYSNSDEQFYRQIVTTYTKEYEKNRQKLTDFLDSKDLDNYRISVHALKSTSKMIGADCFSRLAFAAEEAAKKQDEAYLQSHQKELLTSYQDLTDTLRHALGFVESECVDTTDRKEITRSDFIEALKKLAECLKTFEAERAQELLDQLDRTVMDGMDISLFLADIRADITDFEMNKAEKKVLELIEQQACRKDENREQQKSFGKGGEM